MRLRHRSANRHSRRSHQTTGRVSSPKSRRLRRPGKHDKPRIKLPVDTVSNPESITAVHSNSYDNKRVIEVQTDGYGKFNDLLVDENMTHNDKELSYLLIIDEYCRDRLVTLDTVKNALQLLNERGYMILDESVISEQPTKADLCLAIKATVDSNGENWNKRVNKRREGKMSKVDKLAHDYRMIGKSTDATWLVHLLEQGKQQEAVERLIEGYDNNGMVVFVESNLPQTLVQVKDLSNKAATMLSQSFKSSVDEVGYIPSLRFYRRDSLKEDTADYIRVERIRAALLQLWGQLRVFELGIKKNLTVIESVKGKKRIESNDVLKAALAIGALYVVGSVATEATKEGMRAAVAAHEENMDWERKKEKNWGLKLKDHIRASVQEIKNMPVDTEEERSAKKKATHALRMRYHPDHDKRREYMTREVADEITKYINEQFEEQ